MNEDKYNNIDCCFDCIKQFDNNSCKHYCVDKNNCCEIFYYPNRNFCFNICGCEDFKSKYKGEDNMKESKPLYVIWDQKNFHAIMWETELGKIITCEGKINLNNNLIIRDIETNEDIKNVDLRNVLMSILPV